MADDYQVTSVSYWKEIRDDLNTSLRGIKDSLLLIHNSVEFKELANFFNQLPLTYRILYISLTKTYDSMGEHFKKVKPNIFVVDCVSSSLFKRKSKKNCAFEKPPSTLDGAIQLADTFAEKFIPEFIVIDSLSLFLSGSQGRRSVSSFAKKLKDLHKARSCKTIVLYDSNVSRTNDLPTIYFDTTMKIEAFRDKIQWRG